MRRLKSYSRTSLRFQSVGGQRVLSSYQQLRSLVVKRVQQAGVAEIFSIPEEDGEKQELVWYTDLPGKITAFPELDEDQRQQRSKELNDKFQALRSLAAQFRADAPEGRRSLEADIIEAALSIPDESCKFVVGEQIVVAGWGASLTTTARPAVDVIWKGEAPAARALPEPSEIVNGAGSGQTTNLAAPARTGTARVGTWTPFNWGRRGRWLIWLIPLILLLLAIWLILKFGLPWVHSTGGADLPSTALPPITEQGEAGDARLRREIAELKRKLEEKLAACVPLQKSDLSPKAPTGQGQSLAIPADAAAKKDLSSLSGCWNSPSVPITIRAGSSTEETDLAEVVLCFSPDGKTGKRTIKSAKVSCEGSLAANFKNENVVIDAPTMTCADQSGFSSAAVTCKPAGAKTSCQFAQENNPDAVEIVFSRRGQP